MRPLVVVAGSLAQRRRAGGHAWVFLQYLLGFRRLGHDVLFLDRLEPEMAVDSAGDPTAVSASANLRDLERIMQRFGLRQQWAVFTDGGRRCHGLERDEVLARVSRSVLLLDVMGFMDVDDVIDAAPSRVFLDIDPGFGQMWCALGLADLFAGHDHHVTIGERIGAPDCTVPTCGIDWITTRQPIVLDHWPAIDRQGAAFTSVGSWRGPFAPIEFEGAVYGLRVHEFRRFLDVPDRSGAPFEIALDIHPDEVDDLARIDASGWTRRDPTTVAGDPWAYRRYVQGSRAEFMVAKNMYVASRSGWFSDRSVCYLASGRPVLAQDTGIGSVLPVGEGLLVFADEDDAVRGVEQIQGDWPRHSRAARRLAESHFDSDLVLTRLLDALGERGIGAGGGG